jgi:hypothetical protein
MTPKELQALHTSTERDVGLVLAACLPDDFIAGVIEPKMATGCIHPFGLLYINRNDGTVFCGRCNTRCDQEVVAVRMESFYQGKE